MTLSPDSVLEHPLAPCDIPLRLLVVDDAPGVADTLAALFRHHGHEVRTALNGADALAVAYQFDPHCVLLDLQMPVLCGGETAQHLRANVSEPQRLVIIAATAYPADYPGMGPAFDYRVDKPLDIDHVYRLIDTACCDRW